MATKQFVKPVQGLGAVGTGAFTTTGATVEIDVAGLKRILGVVAMPVENCTATVTLFLDEAVGADGYVAVPGTGTVTLKRTVTTDSGLKFSYIAFGQ